MKSRAVDTDNRNPDEIIRLQEARIEALRAYVESLQHELEAERRNSETARLMLSDALREVGGILAETK